MANSQGVKTMNKTTKREGIMGKRKARTRTLTHKFYVKEKMDNFHVTNMYGTVADVYTRNKQNANNGKCDVISEAKNAISGHHLTCIPR